MPLRVRTLTLAFAVAPLLLLSAVHWKYLRLAKAEDALRAFTYDLRDSHFTEAQRQIEAAIKISPNNSHYLMNAGLLHERMLQRGFNFEAFRNPELSEADTEHVKTAIQYYQKAVALNPRDDHALHNLGWLSWLVKDREQAFAYLQQAAKINEGVALYPISLGILREYNGELDAAYQQYGRAIRIAPSEIDSRFFADLKKRSPAQAEKIVSDAFAEFQEQVRLGAGPTVKAKLGKLALDRQPDLAMRTLKEATAELSNLTRPWISLGMLYEQQGDNARAELCYKKSIFIDGGEPPVWFHLGKLYDRQNNKQTAINNYRKAIQKWVDQTSLHASRVRRIYISRSTMRDDVIPSGFDSYTTPSFDIDWTCARLAEWFHQQGDEATAAQYENIRKEYAR